MEAISGLRKKFGGSILFGNEKDDSFKSSIGQIYQTFGGEELYLLSPRWFETHSKQHPRGPHPDDCREQDRREGCDGESGGESD